MNKYVVICHGSDDPDDPLRHDPVRVASIDDDRAAGGEIAVVGTWGFEDMVGVPSGNRTYRMRCAVCGHNRNVFVRDLTVARMIDSITASGAELGAVKLPYLPPEIAGRFDSEQVREQLAALTGESVEDGSVLPFTVLNRIAQLLGEDL